MGQGGWSPPAYNPYDLNNDPFVMMAMSEANRRRSRYDAQDLEARRQALISFGGSVDGYGLSPEDIAAANANNAAGNSVIARLAKAHEQRQKGMINQLAGRGMIFSGETGYQTLEEGQRYGSEQFDARGKLLDYLRGIGSQRLDREDAIIEMINQARMQAWQSGVNDPNPPGGIPAPSGNPLAPIAQNPAAISEWLRTITRPTLKRKFGLAF